MGRVPGACCLAVFLAAADAAATDAVGMSDNDSDFEDQDDVYSQFMQRKGEGASQLHTSFYLTTFMRSEDMPFAHMRS